jgi:hypothetical protein
MTRHVRQPWERLPDETEEAHALFRTFLALDPPRRLNQVAKLSHRAVRTISEYSSRRQWFARAAAYDDAQKQAMDRAALGEVERIGREHARAAALIRDLGLAELQRRARKVRRAMDLGENDLGDQIISDRDALAMFREGALLERLVIGQATERKATEESPWDLSKLTAEEVELLRVMKEKATS